jgi:hypothetical protein
MLVETLRFYGPSFVGATLIVLVHLFVARMRFLHRQDGVWLDLCAGVAVAYVFVDILPHLAGKQEKLAQLTDRGIYGFLEHHIYLLALAGFLVYLGVVFTAESRRESLPVDRFTLTSAPMLVKFEALSFAGYSFIIGYMLAEQPIHRIEPPLVFALVMAAHFVGLDHLFRRRYPTLYDDGVRYLLVATVYGGWLTGFLVEMSGALYAIWFAFLAGGIIIVTMIFELPRVIHPRRYIAFCAGAILFTLVVLLLEYLRAID